MKKLIFMLAFVACMAFVACNNNAAAEVTDSLTADSTEVETVVDSLESDTLICMGVE